MLVNNIIINMDDIGRRLREERRRLGLNQDDFAELGGVKKNAQLHYENGSRSPDAAYLTAIAEAGVDVLYVLTGSYSAGMLPTDESQLLAGYRALDARGKAGVLGMIGGLTAPAGAVFRGEVGQVVQGNQIQTGPVSFTVGGKKKKETP